MYKINIFCEKLVDFHTKYYGDTFYGYWRKKRIPPIFEPSNDSYFVMEQGLSKIRVHCF